jgi:hypothetical protein
MPVPGAIPKDDRSQVRTRHKPVADWVDVENVPFEGAPPLRDRATGGISVMETGAANSPDWPQATLDWWRDISRMPHAAHWTDSEWRYAMDTAEIHARTMEAWRGYTGASLLPREKQMGVTADFRRGLRIRYVDPKDKSDDDETAAGGANVVQMNAYRDL